MTRTHAGSSARVTLSQAASLLSGGVGGRETRRSIDRTVTRSMRATLQPSQRTGRQAQQQQQQQQHSPGNLATREPRTSTVSSGWCDLPARSVCGVGGDGGGGCGAKPTVLHRHTHGSIDGTIFFTASYRCGGSGGLDHGCAQARGRQHQQ